MDIIKQAVIAHIKAESLISFYTDESRKPPISSYVGSTTDTDLNIYFQCPPKAIKYFPSNMLEVEIRMLGIPGKVSPIMDTQVFLKGRIEELTKIEDIKLALRLKEKKWERSPNYKIIVEFNEKLLKGKYKSVKFYKFVPISARYITQRNNIRQEAIFEKL